MFDILNRPTCYAYLERMNYTIMFLYLYMAGICAQAGHLQHAVVLHGLGVG